MLSSLRRNGFAESLSVTKHHRNAVLLNRRLCIASQKLALGSDIPLWQPITARPFAGRLYSTSIPPQTAKSKNDSNQPIPSTVPARKQKIELRPAPLKVQRPTHAPTEPAAASSKPPAPQASPSASASTSSHSQTIAETTKHDLEDASQHGILVPPPEGAGVIRRLFHQGKELFKFYWRGIKLIESNRRYAKAMRERVAAGGAPLTWWETQFIRRNKEDMLKLIPFALIILVIEEIIPLVVLYAPFILPSTCVLPSQKDRIDSKRREKQRVYALQMRPVYELVHQRGSTDPNIPTDVLLDSSTLEAFNALLSLPTWGPTPLLLHRLKKHLAAIAEDDVLLKQEDFGRRLTATQLRDALEERGIVTEDLPQQHWQSRLEWWLSQVSAEGSDADAIRRRVLVVASSGAGKF